MYVTKVAGGIATSISWLYYHHSYQLLHYSSHLERKGTRHWHSFPCVVDLVAAKTSRTEGIQLATKLENVVGAVIIQTSKLVFLLYIHPR